MNIPIMSSTHSQGSVGTGQNQPPALKEGQMVHGKIKQLFPGQKAEIQIGNQTMVAKLEVPLKAGDSYYFQVSSAKPELQMKIIAGPTTSSEAPSQQLNKLMEAMQLPKSNEMTQLLNFAMKNKMPITREGLLQAENLLKGVPPAARADALLAIQKIVELKLPMTEMNLRSLVSAQSKEGLNAVLTSLRASLLTDPTVSADVKSLISASLDKVAKPFADATSNAVLAKALVNLLDKNSSAESRFANVQLLKSAGVLPERTSLANLQQVLTSMVTAEQPASRATSPVSAQTTQEMTTLLRQITQAPTTSIASQLDGLKALINAEAGLSTANKATLTALVDQAATAKPTAESSARFVQQFNEALAKMTTANPAASPVRAEGKGNTAQEPMREMGTLLRQMTSSPTPPTTSQLDGLKALVTVEPSLSTANKATLTALVDQAAATTKPTAESTARFVQQFSEALVKMTAENTVAAPFQTAAKGETAKEPLLALLNQASDQASSPKLAALVQAAERSQNPEVQKLLQAAEVAVTTAVEGKAVKEAMQTVIRSLGLNYESALLGKDADLARLAETLKPQLLALMQDPAVSQTVKDGAEAVVSRMNGPLLMSGETGAQHQLVMQVPLEFFGKRIDATLEWNGRMKENGKIDPDFARVLFYLDLHSLEKTVIDMQVQNKVVSVTVFNTNANLKAIGTPLIERLKEGLDNSGYQLSGVFFKDFEQDKEEVAIPKEEEKTTKQGVDFRI